MQEAFFLRFANSVFRVDKCNFAATLCIKHRFPVRSSIDGQYFYCLNPRLKQLQALFCLTPGKQGSQRKAAGLPNGNNQKNGWPANNNCLVLYFQIA